MQVKLKDELLQMNGSLSTTVPGTRYPTAITVYNTRSHININMISYVLMHFSTGTVDTCNQETNIATFFTEKSPLESSAHVHRPI